jgi:branched-subunit amino acid transport protein
VPVAIFVSLVVPELLLVSGQVQFSLANAKLMAGLVAVAVAWRTRNILLTLLAGMAVLHLVRLLSNS